MPDSARKAPGHFMEADMTAFNKTEVAKLYRRRARRYDFSAYLYYLAGFRYLAYREKAVRALNLKPGDTVVEIGCGTGLNFPLLREEVGPGGRIIGVDLTDKMLERARARVEERGWTNVELVERDAANYGFPDGVNSIISTFALTLVPEFDAVIRNGARALAPGGRWAIADLKMPSNRLSKLTPYIAFIARPFGVTLDLAARHPWESLGKYLHRTAIEEVYGGIAYVAMGEKLKERA